MPEMMLRYRAGSWFGRTECPDLLMGFQSAEEVRDTIEFDPETGEIIPETTHATPAPVKAAELQKTRKPRPDTVVSEQVKESHPQEGEVVEDPAGPEVNGASAERHELPESNEEQLKAQGWYEDGNRKFNIHGEIWNTNTHAKSSKDNNPIVNTDGHFRVRRGGPLPGAAVETIPETTPEGEPRTTTQETTTPGYEPEPEYVDGPDDNKDWMDGLE